jgi:hypothetical protein
MQVIICMRFNLVEKKKYSIFSRMYVNILLDSSLSTKNEHTVFNFLLVLARSVGYICAAFLEQ